jgi:hypothetical protein
LKLPLLLSLIEVNNLVVAVVVVVVVVVAVAEVVELAGIFLGRISFHSDRRRLRSHYRILHHKIL